MKIPRGSAILGWHFVAADRLLDAHYQEEIDEETRRVAPGYVYTEVGGEIKCCARGLHASRLAIDALEYAPGPIVCRVALWGAVDELSDKLAARHREVLWMADATRALRLYACWCVRETPIGDGRKVWDLLTDPRSRAAVETAERYARGKATSAERDAAWAAAWDAAWAAARAAQYGQFASMIA